MLRKHPLAFLFLFLFFLAAGILNACGSVSEPPCPTSLPPAALAACQAKATQTEAAIYTQVMDTAYAIVRQTMTAAALSATPTPTASPTLTLTSTYTPQPTPTVWRIEPTVTAIARQRSPLALNQPNPLPDFGIGIERSLTQAQTQALHLALLEFFEEHNQKPDVDTAFFHIFQALEGDWDRDGQTETVFLYALGSFPYQHFGTAMARGEQILQADLNLWKGEFADSFTLRAVPLSPRQTAILVQLRTVTSGSGVYPEIYRRLYLWGQNRLQTIWDWQYSGGGRAGWANSWANNEQIRFLHLSGQPQLDLLLSRTDSEWAQFDNPGNYLFYSVHLPGELLFSWDEPSQTYQLSHFYDGGRLTRIRPADFFVHAPRLEHPLTLDGSFYDWYQVEYASELDGYGAGNFSRSAGVLRVRAAFDDSFLYLFLQTHTKTRLWLGFDADLSGDFEAHTLNQDDTLFEIQLSQQDPPSCNVEKAGRVFPQPAALQLVSRPMEFWDAFCQMEIRIPLSDLSLPSNLTPRSGYALRPQLDPQYDNSYAGKAFTEYYPQPGALIGFAVIGENESAAQNASRFGLHFLSWQPEDPATWGTLLFIADH